MSATHDHDHGALHDAMGVQRSDPTGTATLRNQYSAQLYKRYRKIKGANRKLMVEIDPLRLGGDGEPQRRVTRAAANDDHDGEEFPEPEETPEIPGPLDPSPSIEPGPGVGWDVRDYREWLRSVQDRVIIGPEQAGGGYWSDQYLRYAYDKGATDADRRAKQVGVIDTDDAQLGLSFDMPIHEETIQTLLEHNQQALEGVNDATRKEVGRVLADAMLEGKNPRVAAREMNERFDAIGITRARTHARTAIVKSYNEASLRRYEQLMGEDGQLAVLVEFTTANDSAVCERCMSMEGRTYSVREAKGVIPVHANCRCTWVPVQRGVDA